MASSGRAASSTGEVIRFEPAGGSPLRAPVVLAHELAFALGAVRIEPAVRQVAYPDGSTETLEPRVMEVLVALHRAGGAILSRDDLTAACWHGNVVGEDAIQRVIQRLRKAADRSGAAFRIETITKVGYRLIADGTIQSATVESAVPASPARRRSLLVLAAAALAVLLAAGLWFARGSEPFPVTVGLESFTATSPEQRALAGRLTEIFRHELVSGGTGIQTGSASVKVRGVVSEADGVITLAVRLDDAATGATLWSKTGEVPGNERSAEPISVFPLSYVVNCGVKNARTGAGAADTETIGMLLRHCNGMQLDETPEATLDNARRLAAKAPQLWAAQLAVAEAVNLRLWEPADDEAALVREGIAAADRAIALIPDAADAYWTKAMGTPANRPLAREALFRKAIASRFVNCACGLQFYGDFLLQSGRASDALAMYQRGSIKETEDLGALWRIFISASSLGKDEVAEAALTRLDALKDPADPVATEAHRFRAVSNGDYRMALALVPKESRTSMDVARRATYTALVSGDPTLRTAALAAIGQVREDNRQEIHTIGLLAALGATDQAFALLERSRRRGGSFSGPGRFPGRANMLVWEPSLAPLWRDPRFTGFLGRAGFIAYWRGSKSRPDVCDAGTRPPFCRLLERGAT